jgi:ketosteroid isomerase-like protein
MTSTSSPISTQLATARRFVEAIDRHDLEAAQQCVTEPFLWHIPGETRVSGDHRGWAGFLEFAALLRTLTDGTFHSENLDVLAGERTIVVYQRNTGQRAGRRLDLRACYVLEFDGDRIAAGRAFYEDQSQVAAFWA